MKKEQAYKIARERAEAKVNFFIHLTVFIIVISMLTFINYFSNAQYFWVKWPFLGWGIAVLFHALNTFVFSRNASHIEKMVDKEMQKQGWEGDENLPASGEVS